MKGIVLYRPNSENSRKVEEYVRDFERTRHQELQLVSLNTRDGAAMASLYDVMDNPRLLVLREDGQVIYESTDTTLPLMSEVAMYLAA